MNDINNKFLLAGDKFMPEMDLRQPAVFNKNKKQPGFTYSARGTFAKNRQSIQKFTETGNRSLIFKNKLDEASFQHDMAYGDFKDLKRRTQSDKVLKDKAFETASNPKYDGYQRGLASMVYKFF